MALIQLCVRSSRSILDFGSMVNILGVFILTGYHVLNRLQNTLSRRLTSFLPVYEIFVSSRTAGGYHMIECIGLFETRNLAVNANPIK